MLKNIHILNKAFIVFALLLFVNAGYGQSDYEFVSVEGFASVESFECGEGKTVFKLETDTDTWSVWKKFSFFKDDNACSVDDITIEGFGEPFKCSDNKVSVSIFGDEVVFQAHWMWVAAFQSNGSVLGFKGDNTLGKTFYAIVEDDGSGGTILTIQSNPPYCGPIIEVDKSSLSGFEYCEGKVPSSVQSFIVSGENLTKDVVVKAPEHYEVSTDGTIFSGESSITLSKKEVTDGKEIFVRLKEGLSIGAYDEKITISTAGTEGGRDKEVRCNGGVADDTDPGKILGKVDAVCAEDAGEVLTLENYTGDVVKWQCSNDGFVNDIRDIENTGETYILPALTEDTYYRAVLNNGYREVYSTVKKVESNAGPEITSHPSLIGRGVCVGTPFAEAKDVDDVPALDGVTGGELYVAANNASSYQWYSNTTLSNEGGTIVEGAKDYILTPQSETASELYYYCVVTNLSGCSTTSLVSGVRTVDEMPEVEASAVATTVYSNGTLILRGKPNEMADYLWTMPDPDDPDNSRKTLIENQNVTATANRLVSGDYILNVTTRNGCKDSDTVKITVTKNDTYYYDGDGDITDVNNWWSNENADGGNHPTNFTDAAKSFIVLADAASWGEDWNVSGNGSRVIVDKGATLTIPSDKALKTAPESFVDVKTGANLIVKNKITPNLGALSPSSTVEYAGTVDQTVKAASYGNLEISGGYNRTVTLAQDTIKCSGVFTPNSDCDYVVTGNTFMFDSPGDQEIPAFTFYNLYTELGGTKTLTGDIIVENKFHIGQIVQFNPSTHNIEFQGSGEFVTLFGKMLLGTGDATVSYTGNGAVVAPLPYNNLDLKAENIILSDRSVIQIAGDFIPGTGTRSITGSTVSFNGSSPQTIPAFDFYNLTIDNTSAEDNTSVNDFSLGGNVNVVGVLSLKDGVVDTKESNFTITNTSVGAVSQGSDTSYIKGNFTRNLPADLSSSAAQYLFPVGDDEYLPFTLSSLTTGAAPSVTVSANGSDCSKDAASEGLLTEVSEEYWVVTATGYENGKVSIGKNSLDDFNTIAIGGNGNGAYESLGGVILDKNINASFYTDDFTEAYFALGKRDITIKEYVYDCSGDVNDLSNWKGEDGNQPESFALNDAVWIINCSGTINGDLDLSGANVTLEIRKGAILTVDNYVDFNVNGNLVNSGTFKTYSSSTTTIAGSNTLNIGSKILNAGNLNFNDDVKILGSIFINESTGTVNINNADFSYKTNPNNNNPKPYSEFENYGALNVTSGNFTVVNDYNSNFGDVINFINATGASITIDNTLAEGKEVSFGGSKEWIGIDFGPDVIDFQQNSTFTVKNSDVDMTILQGSEYNTASHSHISGVIVVEDGSMSLNAAQGGGVFNLELDGGAIYLIDTDESKDDGIFYYTDNGGGFQINVGGTLYAEGVQNKGNKSGGNNLNVQDGANVFIADIGIAVESGNSNELKVNSGGTLNYCGNLTSGADKVGIVDGGGTLNYTEGYYTTQTPDDQGDFTVSGSQVAVFEDEAACRAAFLAGTPYGKQFLPIELIALYGTCLESGVIDIEWKTLTETNNDYFTVYRSFDGVTFEEVYVQFGAGTTSEIQEYAFTDYVEHSGIVYYKLTQTDYDGTTKVSKIIAVETCSEISSFVISKNGIEVSFLNPNETHVVVITSLMGQILYTKSFSGVYEAYIETSNMFTKGLYVVSVYTSTQIKSQKFVK